MTNIHRNIHCLVSCANWGTCSMGGRIAGEERVPRGTARLPEFRMFYLRSVLLP